MTNTDDEPYTLAPGEEDILRKLQATGSLFKTHKGKTCAVVTSHLDEAREELLYGITVNVRPGRLMNKKQWRQYSHDAQKSQLLRIEAAGRRGQPIDCIQMVFEVCPALDQIHFHALYRMPASQLNHLHGYYKRIMGPTSKEIIPWRYLDIKPIVGGPQNWLDYINKTLLTASEPSPHDDCESPTLMACAKRFKVVSSKKLQPH